MFVYFYCFGGDSPCRQENKGAGRHKGGHCGESRCQVRSQRSVVFNRRIVVPRLAQNHTAYIRHVQQVSRRGQPTPTECCISMLSVMLRDNLSRNVS